MKSTPGLTLSDFLKKFPDEEKCYAYLSRQKWPTQDYSCRKCGHEKYCKGKKPHSRRCGKCGYDESPTAQTIFHRLKINIHTAFLMVFEIMTNKKGANSCMLSDRYNLRQDTCWYFRQRVQLALSDVSEKLHGLVEVDEFEIGGKEEGKQGRSKSDKKVRVVLMVEKLNNHEDKVKRGFASVIQDFSSDSLGTAMEKHICPDSNVVTDKWSGYSPLTEKFKNLSQKYSDGGLNFEKLHLQILNFKNWLRGTHSYCNKEYTQLYLNEFFYRLNRRFLRTKIVENTLEAISKIERTTRKKIRESALIGELAI